MYTTLKKFVLPTLVIVCFSITPHATRAQTIPNETSRPPEIRMWTYDGKRTTSFLALPKSTRGGGMIAVGDINGDGVHEFIVGAGLGAEPIVYTFSQDGKQLHSFYAYPKNFKGGVRVTVGDVNGDGIDEIITAPGPGIEPEIHVFTQDGSSVLTTKSLAYTSHFLGGVHIASIDLNGDGKAEIITSPGPGGGPHIRVFDGNMNNLGLDFFAYDPSMQDGVEISTIRSPEGSSIVTAIESWDLPIVSTWIMTPQKKNIRIATEFLAFDLSSKNGLRIGAWDIDHDGYDEIVASRNGGTWPEVRIFDRWGTRSATYLLHDPTYRGALSFAQVQQNSTSMPQLVVLPIAPVITGPLISEKYIRVDISEQRVYAFKHGRVAKEFLISSGIARYPTPENWMTSVKEKIPIKDYKWTYGKNHPDNYDLKNVKWNLNIGGAFYIHNAYWHNNFGHKMSHGCINEPLAESEWIYNWADIGTPVETVP